MTHRHKTFVSYHHDNDQVYKDRLVRLLGEQWAVDRSVHIGDIDPANNKTDNIRRIIRERYLRDSTVTVVLVGTQTWQRKHVDWEISASIRQTSASSRSGLLGILLPTYPGYRDKYDPHAIPPRLHDNVECSFAKLYWWSDSPATVQSWIHDAFQRRDTAQPVNSRPLFGQNRSGPRWTD